jgi:hypothetical protein
MVGVTPLQWTAISAAIAIGILLVIFSPLILYFSALIATSVLVFGWLVASFIFGIISMIGSLVLGYILKFAGRNVLIAYIGFWVLQEHGLINKNPVVQIWRHFKRIAKNINNAF